MLISSRTRFILAFLMFLLVTYVGIYFVDFALELWLLLSFTLFNNIFDLLASGMMLLDMIVNCVGRLIIEQRWIHSYLIIWCWLIMMFWYTHLITIVTFFYLFLLLSEPRWRPCLIGWNHWFNRWGSHIVEMIWITLHIAIDIIHLCWILTIYLWWCNMHLLVHIVLLSRIFIGESPTSCLEKPFLIYWINNTFQEVLRILWKCIIGRRRLHILVHLHFHCCIRVMKLLVENLCKTLRRAFYVHIRLLLLIRWNLITSCM